MKTEIDRKYYYRFYENLVILYDKIENIYVILEDVFAEMFFIMINENDDMDFIINKIMNEYEVDYETVRNDYIEFCDKMESLLVTENLTSEANINIDNDDKTEDYIFNLMAERQIPFTAIIEITDKCNLECVHCYRSQQTHNLLNVENFKCILEKLKKMGTLHIVFAGSEPMMHPNIVEFIELVSEYGFVLTLQSNVTMLNKKILDALKKCSVKTIFISLYSANPIIHEKITQRKGSYEKTIKAIKILVSNGFDIKASISIFDINKDEVISVNNLCKELGIKAGYNFKIIPAIDKNRDTISLNSFDKNKMLTYITDPKLKLFEQEIKRSRAKCDIQPSHYCYTGFRSITITYDLNIIICNAYRKICGSLLVDDLEEIWKTSDVLNNWRNIDSIVNKKCQKCQAYQYCEPCPAHQYTKTGIDSSIDDITCMYGKMFWEVCEQAKIL